MIINLARRAHNHNFELDPIIRSLLDTDFYKLLMLQLIWKEFHDTRVTFSLVHRTGDTPMAGVIDPDELCAQLDHVRQQRFHKSELIWLAGNTFYGKRGIFEPDFIEWLEHGFQLSDYNLSVHGETLDLNFHGTWPHVTLWEIYALAIVSEMRTRASLKYLSEFELDILYARAKAKLWGKIERLREMPDLRISDFGTRRRHSFLWQEYVVNAMNAALGPIFTGTSNSYLAYKLDLEAIGTNAHELPMGLAALARNEDELRTAQYRILEMWQNTYQGALHILLPDTFGTTQFLRNAPDWVADWTGQRADSKDPFIAGDEYIAWLEQRGRDPRQKLFIASDSLDDELILRLHQHFAGRIRFSAGWGTLLTNDFRDCNPQTGATQANFTPPRTVCKLTEVEGRPAVKLSDNYLKALGPPSEVERYRRIFGSEGMSNRPIQT